MVRVVGALALVRGLLGRRLGAPGVCAVLVRAGWIVSVIRVASVTSALTIV